MAGPLSGVATVYSFRQQIWAVAYKQRYQKQHEVVVRSGSSEIVNLFLIKRHIDLCKKIWELALKTLKEQGTDIHDSLLSSSVRSANSRPALKALSKAL